MVESEEERGRRKQGVRHQNYLFYADNGMFTSSDSRWLQGYFSTLVGLFYRVVLHINVGNIVGMVFRLCRAPGTQSEAA